jgi:hypothetical protein
MNGSTQQVKILFTNSGKITTFRVAEAGDMYLDDYGMGELRRPGRN